MKNNKDIIKLDLARYGGEVPYYERKFIRLFRRSQILKGVFKWLFKCLFILHCRKRNVEFPIDVSVGPGLYLGHTFGITVNPGVVIGKNCNIHKNVTIGQENRGERKGTPTIGDNVYFGIGCVVVGKINVGNDVLIAPGAFVNVNVPSHSIVIGNPCRIISRENATKGYIQNGV